MSADLDENLVSFHSGSPFAKQGGVETAQLVPQMDPLVPLIDNGVPLRE